MSRNQKSVKSLVAQATYTEAIYCRSNEKATLTVTGTYAGTISILVSVDGGTTWVVIDTVTADAVGRWDLNGGGDMWKAGFETGEYTSGTAVVALSAAKANTN